MSKTLLTFQEFLNNHGVAIINDDEKSNDDLVLSLIKPLSHTDKNIYKDQITNELNEYSYKISGEVIDCLMDKLENNIYNRVIFKHCNKDAYIICKGNVYILRSMFSDTLYNFINYMRGTL